MDEGAIREAVLPIHDEPNVPRHTAVPVGFCLHLHPPTMRYADRGLQQVVQEAYTPRVGREAHLTTEPPRWALWRARRVQKRQRRLVVGSRVMKLPRPQPQRAAFTCAAAVQAAADGTADGTADGAADGAVGASGGEVDHEVGGELNQVERGQPWRDGHVGFGHKRIVSPQPRGLAAEERLKTAGKPKAQPCDRGVDAGTPQRRDEDAQLLGEGGGRVDGDGAVDLTPHVSRDLDAAERHIWSEGRHASVCTRCEGAGGEGMRAQAGNSAPTSGQLRSHNLATAALLPQLQPRCNLKRGKSKEERGDGWMMGAIWVPAGSPSCWVNWPSHPVVLRWMGGTGGKLS